MQVPHTIQTLRFELRAEAVPLARQLPDRFSALCQQQLAMVLEEELTAHCPPHQQLRLSQLVLELPPVADRRLEAELPDLLRQALRTALAQLSASDESAISSTPTAASWLAVLEHFLRFGHLPWQVAAGSFSLDEVLRSVVKHQATAFRTLLVRLGQTARLRQRLAWQLNLGQMQLLLVVLEPTHAPFLYAYLLATIAAHRHQPFTPVTETSLRRIVYELVLADLLLHAGTAFNRRAFIERQVRQLAARYNLSFAQLLRQLVAAEVAVSPSAQSVLFVVLEGLHQQYQQAESGQAKHNIFGKNTAPSATAGAFSASLGLAGLELPSGTVADSPAALAAALTYYLQHGSLPLAGSALTPLQLAAAFPAWLAQGWRVLQASLQAGSPAALLRLVHFFPEPLLTQVLRLAAAGQVRPVQGVMEAVWQQQQAARPGAKTRQNLWAHTFTYLLRDDFRPFNSPAFHQWLGQQLAASGTKPAQGAAASATSNISSIHPQAAIPAHWASVNALSGTSKAPRPESEAQKLESHKSDSHLVFPEALAAQAEAMPSRAFSEWVYLLGDAGTGAYPAGLAPTRHSRWYNDAVQQPGGGKPYQMRPRPYVGSLRSSAGITESQAISRRTSTALADINALSPLQMREVLQQYLTEGTISAWLPRGAAVPAQLRAVLARVIRNRDIPDFLRSQTVSPTARQRLVELADFSQLTTLLAVRQRHSPSPQAAAALAALERREVTSTSAQPSGWLLFLRSAYLAFHLQSAGSATSGAAAQAMNSPDAQSSSASAAVNDSFLRAIQRMASSYQLSWPATLGKIRRLLVTKPVLLADSFFASLHWITQLQGVLKATSTASTPPSSQLPAGTATSSTSPSNPSSTTQPTAALPLKNPTSTNLPASAPTTAGSYAIDQSTTSQSAAGSASTGLTSTDQSTANLSATDLTTTGSATISQSATGPSTTNLSAAVQPENPELPTSSPAQNASSTSAWEPAERLTQLPVGVAARDLVFHLLRHQRAPWWAPAGLTTGQQRQLLAQVAHEYQAELKAFLHTHRQEPGFRQVLAELADFAQLAQFVAQPSRLVPERTSPALMESLDRLLARAGAPVAQLLRQAYLATNTHPTPADIQTLAASIRAQALRAGTSWRTVLRYVAWLHRQLPALAATPFFAALLAAATTHGQLPGSHQFPNGRRLRSPQRPGSATNLRDATTAFQELEHYLRTGQAPAPMPTPAGALTAAGREAVPTARPAAAETVPQLFAAQWKLLLLPEHRPALQPLRPLLASGTVRTRLLTGLSEREFWQLLRQLYPDHYRLAVRLAADWQLLGRQGLVRLRAPALFEVLLALIQATPVASWRPDTTVRALLAAEEQLWPQAAGKRGQSRAGEILTAIARRGLVLRGPLGALLTVHHHRTQPAAKPTPPSTPIPYMKEDDTPRETVYIANAGLVLLWPFLTMLFGRLGYVEKEQFRDDAARQQAALLLQFLASGAEDVPEYQLPLNKLLCAIPQGQPLPRELLLTTAEKELGESLLKAVIARWEILQNTSVAGLRETFLLRPGKLEWLPERITLTVETKTLDILMDQRPWSISIIKLPWMAAPLYVTWR